MESRREDPLFDLALEQVGAALTISDIGAITPKEISVMVANAARCVEEKSDVVSKEAKRILRRLCEKNAFLVVSPEMEKAVILRETVPGRHTRIAVMDRDVAHQFALCDWVECKTKGRVLRYVITDAGRASLKRLLEEDRARQVHSVPGMAEQQTPFQAQHQEFGERHVPASHNSEARVVRFNLAESPLLVLGRKKDRTGAPYLSPELIEAGERFREDFELAQMGPRVAQNWEHFLTAESRPKGGAASRGPCEGPAAARDRFGEAMHALGSGLSDVAMRVCCFLEGLETAEKRLGWSARSGKVVLKIALQRLAVHYDIKPKTYHSRELG
ncbi:DUF6456 domain-containing protein [Algicella marina]|uniref:DUF6456 domain-containing protein n=1 Tax=Algicella marina TaxID=2683284 RepID=UPI0024DFF9B4|nr:DUF6456 domain-containing protein [Algicella marina]